MAQLTDSTRLGLPKSRKIKIESNAAADVPLGSEGVSLLSFSTCETSSGTITATAAIKTNGQGQAQTTLRTTNATTVRGRRYQLPT